jgi:hypothetical protein
MSIIPSIFLHTDEINFVKLKNKIKGFSFIVKNSEKKNKFKLVNI